LGNVTMFLIIAILVSMKEYFIVVLMFIFIMTNDIEHLFMCILAICLVFQIFCPFLIELLVFCH
jgi:hypothetical protein